MPDFLHIARLAQAVYHDESHIRKTDLVADYRDTATFKSGGVFAFAGLRENSSTAVVAFRGSEIAWDDWANNLKCAAKVTHVAGGRVHRGFQDELQSIWASIESKLWDWGNDCQRELRVDFCGHSKGGALATLAALRWQVSPLPGQLGRLVTFGAPRVGDKEFVAACDKHLIYARTWRFANAGDPVPITPSWWRGFTHHCEPYYFDCSGTLHAPGEALCLFRMWESLGARLWAAFKLNPLTIYHHAVAQYVDLLERHLTGPHI